ncbi:MAG: MGMT family protein [Candidatus Thorarchaeota archaeon]|nr:MGMT family protein [Candidatus Thorarchaeota archaeon]
MKYRLFKTVRGYSAILFDDDIAKWVFLPGSKEDVLERLTKRAPEAKATKIGVDDIVTFIIDFCNGEDVTISMARVDKSICTPFQLRVLEAERMIPRGMTTSYAWVARKAGTRGVRAVGNALANNPFPFIVPCHRSIRMNRSVGKYRGGPEMKRDLLEMEGVQFDGTGRVAQEYFLK